MATCIDVNHACEDQRRLPSEILFLGPHMRFLEATCHLFTSENSFRNNINNGQQLRLQVELIATQPELHKARRN